jgi:hypothetical protein
MIGACSHMDFRCLVQKIHWFILEMFSKKLAISFSYSSMISFLAWGKANIRCLYPVSSEFGLRDEFAKDCRHSHLIRSAYLPETLRENCKKALRILVEENAGVRSTQN